MSTTKEVEVTVNGGATQAVATAKVEPINLVHKSITFSDAENETCISKDEAGVLHLQKTRYANGTIVVFKQGKDSETFPVDTAKKEECDTLAEAYYKSRLLRMFGYTKFKGVRITKVDFQVNGMEKRFVPPSLEEGDTEISYMNRNKQQIVKMVGELSEYLQKSQGNVDALLSFMKK
jgi:hypothetical protein